MEKNKYIIVVVLGIIVLVVYFLIEKLCNSCIYNLFREDFLKFIEDNIAKHKEIYLPICIVIILIIIICLIIFFIDTYKKYNYINKNNIDELKLFVECNLKINLKNKENILFNDFNDKNTIEGLDCLYEDLFKDKSCKCKSRVYNRLDAMEEYVKAYDYLTIINNLESIVIVIIIAIITILSNFLSIYIIFLYIMILFYMVFIVKAKYNPVKEYGIDFIKFRANVIYLINYLRSRLSLEIQKNNNIHDDKTIKNELIISLNENLNNEKVEEIKSCLAKYENSTLKIFIWNNCK